ncbi:hypothetical protein LMG27174_03202 [Paraburkholderia rhynchosiae]|uniref:Uncharacterized protein n=1 Tax=Paraburkholderia rhynchosiae TaxID=487049 RepID=A0A6J5B590_9BURK|nr:hypothetical protein LMG27174_03202 [Paraburkholderia rhynchosiae]
MFVTSPKLTGFRKEEHEPWREPHCYGPFLETVQSATKECVEALATSCRMAANVECTGGRLQWGR